MISRRSNQPEWIDLGPSAYTPQEYRECLYQLDRIGRWLGGDRATFWALKQLENKPSAILDVGCGGGLFTIRLASLYPQANVAGIDISKEAIGFAEEQLRAIPHSLPNIHFFQRRLEESPEKFDVVTSTLVCHHLSDQELISFLQEACQTAKQAVILNDLHRHPLASIGFAAVAPLFFRNRLIQHDGLLSIRRAFTRQDWLSYLKAAGIDSRLCRLTWHFPFRWTVIIDVSSLRGGID